MDLTNRISGYHLVEQLYCGSRTVVYRAIRETDQLPVVIKLLNRDYPSFSELLQFRNQYTIAKNLRLPGVVQPYNLDSYRHSYALVMEDFGGISLRDYAQERKLTLAEILEIAIQITDILDGLYRNRVIHKDIKPANVLVHPETKQIKLIDFSIASLLPRETQEIQNPNVLEGTLAYISPEQTGRMNRGIDYRTDFYSLGATFYELLTGKLPFECEDPMELVHCHIAKQPPSINSKEIPQVVSDIVMKLMAKNAEKRYQSALGLKHDLERCLQQCQETGKIETFELGMRDVCDRFLIPEKLYGREREIQQLLAAFERVAQGNSEMMLVAGFSGIGKTVVVNEVHKPIVRQRGYFIKGKFDQFQRNIPFSAFVQAFRDLMGQLLTESDAQIQKWKNQILSAVGENGQVIIEVIPELSKIIGEQPPAPELSGTAAQNRFNLLFQKFTQVFTSAEHPLVIFLDDLQWTDSASLNLMQLLMADTNHLLLIGAYRDNEVNPGHPLMLTLSEIEKTQSTINTITLAPLSQMQVNQLVADTLKCPENLALPLSQLVFQKTQGNPFFATQFFKALHQDNLIQFNYPSLSPLGKGGQRGVQGGWQCDIIQVNQQALTDDVVEFMALQLEKLPLATQNILKLAACIGNQFDLATLEIVSEYSDLEIAADLWKALQEGLILPIGDVYKFYVGQESLAVTQENSQTVTYKFLHDRVQQAAYSLIPNDQKQSTHLKIGQLLLQNTSEIELEEKVFDIVGHLNLGQKLITQPSERETLAQLNLKAGTKARNSTAYVAARVYLQTGIELLTTNCWQSQYELTLNLYVATTEASYLNADFEDMEKMAALVLQKAQTIFDKVKIYAIQIVAKTGQSQMLQAIAAGRDVLGQLGVDLPSEPDETKISQALQNLASQLQGREIEELVDLPVMSDRQTQAAMELLGMVFSPTFLGMPGLLPLVSATMVSLSLQFGNAPSSTAGYGIHGMVLCAFLGEVETGYAFGRLALNLLDRFNAREFRPLILHLYGIFIQHRKEALREVRLILKEGYTAGIEAGSFLYGTYNIVAYFFATFASGMELNIWEPELANYSTVLAQTKQYSAQIYISMMGQIVQNLRGTGSQPDCLIGNLYDEMVMIPKHHRDNELTPIAVVYIYKLLLAYSFGNYTAALDYITQAEPYLMAVGGCVHVPIFHFYAPLTYLALFPTQPESEQAKILAVVETHQTILHQWAHNAPMNHLHKWYLVEGERHRVLNEKIAAIECYDRAITLAKDNQFINEEALANELAAAFYLDWCKEQFAQIHIINAYYCYTRWGAKAKVNHLEKTYPQLLQPILQQQRLNLNPIETIGFRGTSSSTRTKSTGSTSISDVLDFTSVLKAAQAISSSLELDSLLASLTRIILENSGAKKVVLLLPQDDIWQVRANTFIEHQEIQTLLSPQGLENCQSLPIKIFHYVKNTRQTVVIDNCQTDIPGLIGQYMLEHQPQSVCCNPIINQGHLVGILYLENQVTSGVFTEERLQVINLLASQAAISLENARLYQQAQQALQDLQQAQLQIVQSEKMSALGNLVAGVAHEMNNPLGFISASLEEAKPTFTELIEHLRLYQKTFPNSSDEIKDHASEIDLDYTLEDLPKIINSMGMACDRLKNISTSLRTFSRADKDYKVPFNIHEGIDSTILILKHRLKPNEKRPAIEVITNYGNLPKIDCFPGQINQVFMNIIANAVDALDESNIGRNFAQIKAHSNIISIQTSVENERVKIAIKDNGHGMTESVKQKIFDHLFTTKAVGKGTGLGLAIARQIVVEKHGGAIDVNSVLGEGTEFAIVLPVCSLN
ncbi:ATP-binding sensor histidine kinase [Microcoleus sp. N9_B4]|uniref:ATP-binding sensor histidine kinase n=1 Tax=Microcoleus sp. N9_B4 TaxID=3055386 RepID=UPI002FD38A13